MRQHNEDFNNSLGYYLKRRIWSQHEYFNSNKTIEIYPCCVNCGGQLKTTSYGYGGFDQLVNSISGKYEYTDIINKTIDAKELDLIEHSYSVCCSKCGIRYRTLNEYCLPGDFVYITIPEDNYTGIGGLFRYERIITDNYKITNDWKSAKAFGYKLDEDGRIILEFKEEIT